MPRLSGREREANLIRKANRAAAVGSLMLGEINSWQEFLKADTSELENLPRRQLKSGKSDVKRRLAPEINLFCSRNFSRMTVSKLSLLYDDIKAYRGLELPLKEFEEKYACVNRNVLKGNPVHLTVVISLWGLQFKFPEDEFAKNLSFALQLIVEAREGLVKYKNASHNKLEEDRLQVAEFVRKETFAAHSIILFCFNLLEAYLNGIAWDYVQTNDVSGLSNRKRKLLEDTSSVSIRDKLTKYPQIICGHDVWQSDKNQGLLTGFLEIAKPYRDSLVHPSPFSTPEKFGGYDKLKKVYRIDVGTALGTANLLAEMIELVHSQVSNKSETFPEWFIQLKKDIEYASNEIRNLIMKR